MNEAIRRQCGEGHRVVIGTHEDRMGAAHHIGEIAVVGGEQIAVICMKTNTNILKQSEDGVEVLIERMTTETIKR